MDAGAICSIHFLTFSNKASVPNLSPKIRKIGSTKKTSTTSPDILNTIFIIITILIISFYKYACKVGS